VSGGSDRLARKIHGAADLSSVVRSMKALAASSVGQYERAVGSLHDYLRTIELSLAVCLREGVGRKHPSFRAGAPIGIVIFGSDQGLVGRFNEILMEFVRGQLGGLAGRTACVWAVGARLEQLVLDADLPGSSNLRVPYSVEAITPLVGELLVGIEQARSAGKVDAVYLFHNEFLAGSTYRPVLTPLLPLDEAWETKLATLPWPSSALPQVIDGASSALPALLRSYLFAVLFQACAQSLASENASRLAAMQRAEDNIATLRTLLTAQFHRLRQASIDEELFEVVAGYEALNNP